MKVTRVRAGVKVKSLALFALLGVGLLQCAVRYALSPSPSAVVSSTSLHPFSSSFSSVSPRPNAIHARGRSLEDSSKTCSDKLQDEFGCDDSACTDKVAGFVNYLFIYRCKLSYAVRSALTPVFVLWMLLLIYMMQETTDDYFCLTLQHLVTFLNMSPAVAGVTFLAVGNGAMDVGASVAAFASGVPKLGVGSLLGAGIFVTTLCMATVALVSNVTVNRGEFLRDVWFFFFSVFYLLTATLDGTITFLEAIGFLAIYTVFVIVVIVYAKTCANTSSENWGSSVEKEGLIDQEETAQGPDDEHERLTSTILEAEAVLSSPPPAPKNAAGAPNLPPVRRAATTDDSLATRRSRPRAMSDESQAILRMNSDWTRAFLKTVEDGATTRAHTSRQHREAHSRSLKIRGLLLGVRANNGEFELKPMGAPGGAPADDSADEAPEHPPLPPNAPLSAKIKRGVLVTVSWINQHYNKAMDFLSYPFTLLRKITIPLLEEGKWDWRIAVVVPIISPAFLSLVAAPDAAVGPIPLWALLAMCGLGVSTGLFFLIDRENVPEHGAIYAIWVFVSFIMSLGWVWAIANELVSLIVMFGALLSISDIVMGCCFLAVGSSISDFAANTTIAKEGFPAMAVAATYAGPMFNVLMGLGLPLVINGWKHGTFHLGKDTTVTYLSFGTLMLSLLAAAIVVPLQNYHVSRGFAYALLFSYFAYLVGVFALAAISPQEGEN